jgi:hypothetical protein
MFDFSDTNTSQYKQHSIFVDIPTNRYRKSNEVDKNLFPYQYVENPEPFRCFVKDDFLSKDECAYLVWLAETVRQWPRSEMPFWDERNISLLSDVPRHHFASVETVRLVLGIHQKIKEFVSKSFSTECYADQIGIVRWPPGSYQMPHIDDSDGYSRISGSVVYLNDDYVGGETYYPYYGRSNTPKSGTIFAHHSGLSHLHGVTQISNKTRYTISSTWSVDPQHSHCETQIASLKGYLKAVGQPEVPVDKRC